MTEQDLLVRVRVGDTRDVWRRFRRGRRIHLVGGETIIVRRRLEMKVKETYTKEEGWVLHSYYTEEVRAVTPWWRRLFRPRRPRLPAARVVAP